MPHETKHDLIVIGTGVAGLAAAREALRLGLATATLEAQVFGGLVINVNALDGAPPGSPASGVDLASAMMQEVDELGGESLFGSATHVGVEGTALVVTSDAGRHRARAVVVASGGTPKTLGVPGEAELEHLGVGHCADCDGPMLEGKDAVVVGGGDGALQSALTLTRFCRRVHLVHRRESFRAKSHLVAAVAAAPAIQVHRNSVVDAVLGSAGVEAARIRNLSSDATQDLACAGFFAYIGLAPAAGFLDPTVARDAQGKLRTDADRRLAVPGAYAAGAVRSGCGTTIVDAIADGEAAARAAARNLRG